MKCLLVLVAAASACTVEEGDSDDDATGGRETRNDGGAAGAADPEGHDAGAPSVSAGAAGVATQGASGAAPQGDGGSSELGGAGTTGGIAPGGATTGGSETGVGGASQTGPGGSENGVGGASQTGSGGSGTGGASDLAWAHVFLEPEGDSDNVMNATNGQIALDAAGVTHVLYSGFVDDQGGTFPVRYAECAANCEEGASWSYVTLGNLDVSGSPENALLAVHPDGTVHVVWQTEDLDENSSVIYATCSSDCASEENWDGAVLVQESGYYLNSPLAIAVDSTGAPAILLKGNAGMQYLSCDADCTSSDGWSSAVIAPDSEQGTVIYAALAFAGDRPRLVYELADDVDILVYRECDANCSNPASWSDETPILYGGWHLNLRINSQGQPRLAYNQGYAGSEDPTVVEGDARSYYAWCDGDCTQSEEWSGIALPMEQGDGYEGLSMALDGSDVPYLVYTQENGQPMLMACTGVCESAASTWMSGPVEDPEDVEDAPLTCGGMAAWFMDGITGLALDSAGYPHVVYEAAFRESCGGDVRDTMELIRYAELVSN